MFFALACFSAIKLWTVEPTRENIIMYTAITLAATFINIPIHRAIVKRQKRLA